MKEKEEQKEPTRLGQGSSSDAQSGAGKVAVLFGIHRLPDLQIAGKTVGEVRNKLSSSLNIPKDVANLVNSKEVDARYVLQPGDTLEFVKLAGSKG